MRTEDIEKVRYLVMACAGAMVLILVAGVAAKPFLYDENLERGTLLYFASGG